MKRTTQTHRVGLAEAPTLEESYELLRKAHQETEAANVQLLLVSEASKLLGQKLSVTEILEVLCRVFVPALGDWCLIAYQGGPEDRPLLVWRHGDPSLDQEMRVLLTPEWSPAIRKSVSNTLKAAGGEILSDIGANEKDLNRAISEMTGAKDHRQIAFIKRLGMKSALCVPMHVGSETLAVALTISARDPFYFTSRDLALAIDVAGRAGTRIENARLLARSLEALQLREDFLNVAAHELRTPVTSLLLRSQMLAKDHVIKDPGGFERDVKRLAELVERVVDVSKSSRKPEFSLQETDLGAIVLETLSGHSYELKKAGCALKAEVPGGVPVRVDRTRMVRLLSNLISNAIKFGAGSPIEVTVLQSETRASVSVRDHGIGISYEDQKHVFERFYHVSDHHLSGLGLGLYTSSRIAKAHRGVLRVESEPGRGARFTLELPKSPKSGG
jgi:signal transduction histidine kinase